MKLKVCGITTVFDAQTCVKENVDFIGFIFYKKSPRFMTKEKVKQIISKLNNSKTAFVGVFVNETIENIVDIVSFCNLSMVQLHGDEAPGFVEELRKQLSDSVKIMKAIRVKNQDSLKGIDEYDVDYFLFDTYDEKEYGGTGKQFDYSLLKNIQKPFFVAGGINPDNVKSVLEHVEPFALDINSGVEVSPGVKDSDKIKKIVKIIGDDK